MYTTLRSFVSSRESLVDWDALLQACDAGEIDTLHLAGIAVASQEFRLYMRLCDSQEFLRVVSGDKSAWAFVANSIPECIPIVTFFLPEESAEENVDCTLLHQRILSILPSPSARKHMQPPSLSAFLGWYLNRALAIASFGVGPGEARKLLTLATRLVYKDKDSSWIQGLVDGTLTLKLPKSPPEGILLMLGAYGLLNLYELYLSTVGYVPEAAAAEKSIFERLNKLRLPWAEGVLSPEAQGDCGEEEPEALTLEAFCALGRDGRFSVILGKAGGEEACKRLASTLLCDVEFSEVACFPGASRKSTAKTVKSILSEQGSSIEAFLVASQDCAPLRESSIREELACFLEHGLGDRPDTTQADVLASQLRERIFGAEQRERLLRRLQNVCADLTVPEAAVHADLLGVSSERLSVLKELSFFLSPRHLDIPAGLFLGGVSWPADRLRIVFWNLVAALASSTRVQMTAARWRSAWATLGRVAGLLGCAAPNEVFAAFVEVCLVPAGQFEVLRSLLDELPGGEDCGDYVSAFSLFFENRGRQVAPFQVVLAIAGKLMQDATSLTDPRVSHAKLLVERVNAAGRSARALARALNLVALLESTSLHVAPAELLAATEDPSLSLRLLDSWSAVSAGFVLDKFEELTELLRVEGHAQSAALLVACQRFLAMYDESPFDRQPALGEALIRHAKSLASDDPILAGYLRVLSASGAGPELVCPLFEAISGAALVDVLGADVRWQTPVPTLLSDFPAGAYLTEGVARARDVALDDLLAEVEAIVPRLPFTLWHGPSKAS